MFAGYGIQDPGGLSFDVCCIDRRRGMCLRGTGYRIQVDYHLMCVVLTGGTGCVCWVRDP